MNTSKTQTRGELESSAPCRPPASAGRALAHPQNSHLHLHLLQENSNSCDDSKQAVTKPVARWFKRKAVKTLRRRLGVKLPLEVYEQVSATIKQEVEARLRATAAEVPHERLCKSLAARAAVDAFCIKIAQARTPAPDAHPRRRRHRPCEPREA